MSSVVDHGNARINAAMVALDKLTTGEMCFAMRVALSSRKAVHKASTFKDLCRTVAHIHLRGEEQP